MAAILNSKMSVQDTNFEYNIAPIVFVDLTNAVSMRFIRWYIHTYWFGVSISGIL